MKLNFESGRSMVEILGVLAVVGVLSIGGIYGYSFAIDKYRANELLHEISKRANVVAEQIESQAQTPSLQEFDRNRDFGFAVFDDKIYGEEGTSLWTASDKRFSLKITIIDKVLCKNFKIAISSVVQNLNPLECGDNTTVVLTYNNDLTIEKFSDIGKENDTGADCSAYRGTSSKNTGVFVGFATDGTTPCKCQTRQKWDVNDNACSPLAEGECVSYTSQECPSGQYCSFESSAINNGCTDVGGGICTEGVGECMPLFDGTQVTKSNDGFDGLLTGSKMNWWTASSWCVAHGMQMPSLLEFECFRDSGKISGWDCTWHRFKGRLAQSNFWVTNDPDCRARNLAANGNRVDFDTPRTEHYYSTVCTNGEIQEKELSQVGEDCVNSGDCVAGLFCNTSKKCQEKLADGSACSESESCKSGHCGEKGNNSKVCFTSCSSYTSQECDTGYYCVFNYPRDCTDSGTGACMPIIDGTTLTKSADGTDGFYIARKMNWWSASSLCVAHNMHLASLSEMGCQRGDSCISCCEDRERFYNGKLSGDSWWTSDNNSCLAYNITLNGGTRVDLDTQRTNSIYYSVVCKP